MSRGKQRKTSYLGNCRIENKKGMIIKNARKAQIDNKLPGNQQEHNHLRPRGH